MLFFILLFKRERKKERESEKERASEKGRERERKGALQSKRCAMMQYSGVAILSLILTSKLFRFNIVIILPTTATVVLLALFRFNNVVALS